MNGNSITLSELVVGREGASLTQPITVTVAGGEMLMLQGSNGAGKSTMLKTLAGLLPPYAGRIEPQLSGGPDMPLYLGHKLGLIKEMSVYDNVALWAKLAHVPELVAAAMHYFDLTDIADVAVEKLSAGWQKRVALTRLITMPSIVWLLDEPTTHLDMEGISLLNALLESRLAQGGIAVVASHVSFVSDRVKVNKINLLN